MIEETNLLVDRKSAIDAVRYLLMGEKYFSGIGGVSKDLVRARELFDKAASLGNKKAMSYLAKMCALGLGGNKDYNKAQELLEKLSKIEGIKWIRFLYSYPEGITEELIDVVAKNDKIAKYFDIPIQHISDKILKRMNRKTNRNQIENLIANIRNKIPDVILRTSLIVGFPGETKEDFEELNEFVKQTKFDKLGTFIYSKEDGTPAEKLPEQIHGNTKKARYNKIMKTQQDISRMLQEEKIGKIYEVLVEDMSFDGKYYIGRTMQDVPDIDGIVYIKNETDENQEKILNHFIDCEIVDVKNYDLIARKTLSSSRF